MYGDKYKTIPNLLSFCGNQWFKLKIKVTKSICISLPAEFSPMIFLDIFFIFIVMNNKLYALSWFLRVNFCIT